MLTHDSGRLCGFAGDGDELLDIPKRRSAG